jgi:hypothetical protein
LNNLKRNFDDRIWISININKEDNKINISDEYKCNPQPCISLIQTTRILDYKFEEKKIIKISNNIQDELNSIFENQIVRLKIIK